MVAIACGIAQGLGVGDNTRSMVMTRGLAELTRLGVAMGGEAATFAGLAGMGDLVTTCISPHSRNRNVGEQLGAGRTLDEITAEMNMVAEGVKTAVTAHELAERHGARDAGVRRDLPGRHRRDGCRRTPTAACAARPATKPSPADHRPTGSATLCSGFRPERRPVLTQAAVAALFERGHVFACEATHDLGADGQGGRRRG